MKKKSIVLFLATACMVSILLSGCGNEGTNEEPETVTLSTNVATTEENEIQPDVVDMEDDNNTGDNNDVSTPDADNTNTGSSGTIDDDVIINDGDSQSDAAQIYLIATKFDECYAEYLEFDEVLGDFGKFAVTDLNHNGRLEVIFTDCEGSGAFSGTAIYEVSEDYSSLEIMKSDDGSNYDITADFMMYNTFDCYEKDGVYYYVVEDYTSSGSDFKASVFYLYSFNGVVKNTQISAFAVSQLLDQTDTYRVTFYDDKDNSVSESEYYAAIENILTGYNKMDSCDINWIPLSSVEDANEKAWESYEGFNPASYKSEINYDYSKIWGTNVTYIFE